MATKGGDELNRNNEWYDLDEVLLHFGVKGMRWGVRRSATNGVKSPGVISKGKARIKDEVGSIKRERSWVKKGKQASSMSDQELRDTVNRIQLENRLKSLGSRKEYLKRETVSNEILKKRVDRLQLENSLKQNVGVAMKRQTEIGKSIADSAMKIGMDTYKSNNRTGNAIAKRMGKELMSYTIANNKKAAMASMVTGIGR